ncbi:tolloid-like protein 1, partial [Biomphalaria pfeifferi]
FTAYSFECCCDYVEVRDGSSMSAPKFANQSYSSCTMPSQPMVSSTNAMFIFFHADNSNAATGFRAEYRSMYMKTAL